MRAFIAIEVSDDIRNALGRVISGLKYAGADVKWVKPDAIHLTMKFLGDITDDVCRSVKSALDAIAVSTKPFDLTLKDIGTFSNNAHPRVIWVGLDRGTSEAIDLAERIEESLSKAGLPKSERPFSPHLTIGRVRSPLNVDKLKEKISTLSASGIQREGAIPHKVTSVTLFQSTLIPHGPIYTKLHESKFRV